MVAICARIRRDFQHADVDVEMSEASVAGECSILWSLSPTLSHYTSSVSTKKGRKRAAPTQGPSVVKDPLARARSVRGEKFD
jgi:hypothetical protein